MVGACTLLKHALMDAGGGARCAFSAAKEWTSRSSTRARALRRWRGENWAKRLTTSFVLGLRGMAGGDSERGGLFDDGGTEGGRGGGVDGADACGSVVSGVRVLTVIDMRRGALAAVPTELFSS